MMSVNKIDVAAFNALTPAQQTLVLEGLTKKERKVLSQALAEEFKSKDKPKVNPVEIEKGDTTQLTPEQQQAHKVTYQELGRGREGVSALPPRLVSAHQVGDWRG